MDYYQKYQKYKFKYLNLLSLTNYQSGGGSDYTEEDFILLDKYLYDNSNLTDEGLEILKYYIDENGYLKDKKNPELLEDPITGESIHITNAVLIDKEVYDANNLFNCINKFGNMKIPHNRQIYSPANLVDIRNKLDNDENKNIIKNKIFENFSVKVRTQLKLLKPEQLEILFTKIKINILDLKIERDDTILNLVNYLLENNITDENNNITDKFKNDLKKNYKLLILVPDNKITYEICIIAVKTNSYALKYIPKYNIMTDEQYYELYKEVVTQDGLALKFVPENNKTLDICEKAVTQNGKALEFVPNEKKTFDICEIAVTKNGLALEFVPNEKKTFDICKKALAQNSVALKHIEILFINNITKDQYYKLCEKAIKNKSNTIYYVNANNMTDEQYYELYKEALENNKHLLNLVPENKRTYEIYMLAVTNNGDELKNVILNDNITQEQYYKLCEKAVENYGQAIFYIKTKVIDENNEEGKKYHKPINMTQEQYYELCEKAVTNDGRALEYVHKNIKNITFEQYYKLYEIAVISNGLALQFIPKTLIDNTTPFKYKPKNMTLEQYYELCKKAVTQNGLSISYIPYNIRQDIGKEKYLVICEIAIRNTIDAKPYAKPYEYIELYMQK